MENLKRTSQRWVLTAVAILLFFAVNILADLSTSNLKLDLTEEGLFSISEGTRNILKGLEEPIEVKLFFSEKEGTAFPAFFRYGQRVRDLLREYESLSDGKLRLTIIDPLSYSEAEETAVGLGLQGQQTGDGTSLYLGVVVSDSTDRQKVIPYLDRTRERFLEYDLSKTVHALSILEKPKLSILSSIPLQFGPGGPMAMIQGRSQPYFMYQQFGQFFEVHSLNGDFLEIPEDTDVLFIAHPARLTDHQLYVIDQFVMAGGHAILLSDPYSEASAVVAATAANSGFPSNMPEASDLSKLTTAWGLEPYHGKVVVDFALAQKVDMGGLGPHAVRDYIPWLGITKDYISAEDMATGTLGHINLASSGAFKLTGEAGTDILALLTSSPESGLVDAAAVKGNPDPDDLIRASSIGDGNYILFARISGEAPSAFGAAPPENVENENHLARSKGSINVLVGADTDLLDDRFWVQIRQLAGQRLAIPFADNGAFIIGAIDHLAGSSDLILLRSRGISNRPFEKVEALRRLAEERFLSEEKRLQQKLAASEQRLLELEGSSSGGTEVFTSEQEAEIQTFKAEVIETQRALRAVQRDLRSDIEKLGAWLTFINIGGVPLLLGLAALVLAFRRRRRI